MSLFLVGQKVQLSNKPDMVFVIVEINPDQTYQIQYDCSLQEALHFNMPFTDGLYRTCTA